MSTTVLAPCSLSTAGSTTATALNSDNKPYVPDQQSTHQLSFLELMNAPPSMFDAPWSAYELGSAGSSSAEPVVAGTLTLFGGGEDMVQPMFCATSPIPFGESSDHRMDTSAFLSSSTSVGDVCGGPLGHGTDSVATTAGAQRSDVAYLHSHPTTSHLDSLDFPPPSHPPMSVSVLPQPAQDSQSVNKRSFDASGPDYEEGNDRVNYQPKKARVAVVVEDVTEEYEDDDGAASHAACKDETEKRLPSVAVVSVTPVNLDCSTSPPVPMTTATVPAPPPPPPRSPSPPRSHRPAVPSPLAPEPAPEPTVTTAHQAYSFAMTPTPPPRPVRRRSRSSEIALLKFALDPWLRLSRSLSDGKPVCRPTAPVAPPAPFNPATFPRAGNLRELRRGRGSLPFSFIGCEAEAKWNSVNA